MAEAINPKINKYFKEDFIFSFLSLNTTIKKQIIHIVTKKYNAWYFVAKANPEKIDARKKYFLSLPSYHKNK